MIFALLILCGVAARDCEALTYNEAPYATLDECRTAHAARRPLLRVYLHGPLRVREICAELPAIRRIAPHAYPEHQVEEAT